MVAKKVSLEWLQEKVFRLRDHDNYSIKVGKPGGASASDLLPMSLIGCASWDILAILKKQRQDVRSFHVTAESEQDEDPPWCFRKIHIKYAFSGNNLSPELIQKAITLSEEKYCSVYATLKEVIEITNSFEIYSK